MLYTKTYPKQIFYYLILILVFIYVHKVVYYILKTLIMISFVLSLIWKASREIEPKSSILKKTALKMMKIRENLSRIIILVWSKWNQVFIITIKILFCGFSIYYDRYICTHIC